MNDIQILIINTAERNENRFTDPILEIIKDLKIKSLIMHWSKFTGIKHFDQYDAIIISASPKGDNANFFERLQAFQWLKTYQNPVFGICAGHQLIGVTFGAELISGKEKEEGLIEVKILKNDLIFKGKGSSLLAQQHHNDSISLPAEFEVMASSESCRVQAIRHKTKAIYSVQWHAEISNPELIRNFILQFVLP